MGQTFRQAELSDLAALHRLIERAYRGDSARRGWSHEADLLDGQRTDAEELTELLSDPKRAILMLEDETGLVGCVQIADQGEGLAYLGLLSVEPDRQANGLGRRLVAAAEAHARASFGARGVEMTVIRQRSELIAWYERLGYRHTGREELFPMSDPRFGLPQRTDLVFVVLKRDLEPSVLS